MAFSCILCKTYNYIPDCSVKKGCTFEFIHKGISEFTDGGTNMDPPQCHGNVDNDEHSRKLCNFINFLGDNFTKDDVLNKWIESYVNEDKRFLG